MRNLVYRSQVIKVIENINLPFVGLFTKGRQKEIRETLVNAIMDLEWTNYDDIVPHANQIIVCTKPGSRITRCSRCKVERRNAGKPKYCQDCGSKFDDIEVEEV